ncbi:MAG: drug/metabolite transporter (DMT)-like permease [Candidatus Marinamargulisbacteria bacterium]|jgi:drug/metabolite transporter (DMT)-like permease
MKKQLRLLFFIILPVTLGIYGEFVLKSGINQLGLDMSVASLIPILSNNLVLAGLFCIIVGGIIWVVAMSKYELSFLYPFLSINYLFIIFGSHFFLGESISFNRYLSAIAISIGLIIISRSPYSETQEELTS